MPRVLRIVLQIPPQANNKIINRPRIGIFLQAPNILQHIFARDRLAFMFNHEAQQVRFHQSEPEHLVAHP